MSNNTTRRASLSSISEDAARELLNDCTKGDSKELACRKISGFHLCKRVNKTKVSAAWRLRYTNASGLIRKITIGSYPAMSPLEASHIAAQHRASISAGTDPLLTIKQRKDAQRQLEQQELVKKYRSVGRFLFGPYAEHQSHKINEGKHTLGIIRAGFKCLLDRDIETLSKQDIIHWQLTMYKEGKAHSTVVRAYGALRTMIRYALDNDYLDSNPIANVRLCSPPDKELERISSCEVTQKRRMLTPEELSCIGEGLSKLSNQLREARRNSRTHGKPHLPDLDTVEYPHWSIPFTLIALHTGLRPGDLKSLTWQELNVPFKRLVKVPRKTRHHHNPAQIRQTLSPELLVVVSAWWRQQGTPSNGLVFPSPISGEQLDKKAHVKHWKKVIALGGIATQLDFYSLRHHFISALVSSGIPLLTVAYLAGHKSVRMIEKHYGHLAPDHAAAALASISRGLPTLRKEKIQYTNIVS